MKRTTVLVLAHAAALAALLTGCGGGQGASTTNAANVPQTPTSAPASTPPSKPTSTSTAALEAAYVLEATGLKPELALARAELVTMGHQMCEAFRTKPGTVATLVKNAKADGTSADDVETLRVVAVAAIHNLCPDQAGDL